jgi:hypothetical protein
VHVDEAAVTEVAISPNSLKKCFATENSTRSGCKFNEESELGFREVNFFVVAQDDALVGNDLKIAKPKVCGREVNCSGTSEKSANSC